MFGIAQVISWFRSGCPFRNRPDLAKITMAFYKPGFNRVPKVLKITGPLLTTPFNMRMFSESHI